MLNSRLSTEQRMAIQFNKEFEKRKERTSHSNTGYRSKIEAIQVFELEQYDGGDTLEVLVKKLNTISYNVLQMCKELYNGTPGKMISKIPQVLDLDENTIAKLKQRIHVWATEHQDFEKKDVSIKLVLKNLDQIYSGSYRSLSVVSIAEARSVQLPSWLIRRLKQRVTDTQSTESDQYKPICKKLKTTIHDTSRHSISEENTQDDDKTDTRK
jgi:hypothetical protein